MSMMTAEYAALMTMVLYCQLEEEEKPADGRKCKRATSRFLLLLLLLEVSLTERQSRF